jgi:hypothetical protein
MGKIKKGAVSPVCPQKENLSVLPKDMRGMTRLFLCKTDAGLYPPDGNLTKCLIMLIFFTDKFLGGSWVDVFAHRIKWFSHYLAGIGERKGSGLIFICWVQISEHTEEGSNPDYL